MGAESRGGARAALGVALVLGAATGVAGCLELRDGQQQPQGPCSSCHGNASRPGSELEQAAPPVDVDGNTEVSAPGVGAHALHLRATDMHGAVPCQTCHLVPEQTPSPGHVDSALPAEVVLRPPGEVQPERSPSYDYTAHTCADTYCHWAALPNWVQPQQVTDPCAGCHGIPPARPHVQVTVCSMCHSNVDESLSILDPALHVNGTVEQ
jgi:predicted CxxxxCH...CXXCH cytochrome family protein